MQGHWRKVKNKWVLPDFEFSTSNPFLSLFNITPQAPLSIFMMREGERERERDSTHTCTCGIMANVLDCDIVVSEFELQSHYYRHYQANIFGKGTNFLITPPSYGLNSCTIVFLKNGFGIEIPTRVNIPFNKETELYKYIYIYILSSTDGMFHCITTLQCG